MGALVEAGVMEDGVEETWQKPGACWHLTTTGKPRCHRVSPLQCCARGVATLWQASGSPGVSEGQSDLFLLASERQRLLSSWVVSRCTWWQEACDGTSLSGALPLSTYPQGAESPHFQCLLFLRWEDQVIYEIDSIRKVHCLGGHVHL